MLQAIPPLRRSNHPKDPLRVPPPLLRSPRRRHRSGPRAHPLHHLPLPRPDIHLPRDRRHRRGVLPAAVRPLEGRPGWPTP